MTSRNSGPRILVMCSVIGQLRGLNWERILTQNALQLTVRLVPYSSALLAAGGTPHMVVKRTLLSNLLSRWSVVQGSWKLAGFFFFNQIWESEAKLSWYE